MAKALREFELNWLKQQPMATTPDKDNGHERWGFLVFGNFQIKYFFLNFEIFNSPFFILSLGYSMLLARRTLKQMAEAPMKKEHPYTWLIGWI